MGEAGVARTGIVGVMKNPGKVIIIQGGQWGSEAKGLITHKLTLERGVTTAIRTGTVNAGHTVYYGGRAYAMQQLPVSWVKPDCKLVLGPGAYIHPDILRREVEWISRATGETEWGVLQRVWIDHRCGLHLPLHTDRAKTADRHHKMGATGKGCSEAVVDKITHRGTGQQVLFKDWVEGAAENGGWWQMVADRVKDGVRMANWAYDDGQTLIVEGTQGTLLDLHLGDYPYTTHKQTQAANWLAEAGLACTVEKEVWGVYRTYPIKVAGNSGPMPGETSWGKVAHHVNTHGMDVISNEALQEWSQAVEFVAREKYNIPVSVPPDPSLWTQEEKEHWRLAASEIHADVLLSLPDSVRRELEGFFELTTVTKKLRRIGAWDWPTFRHSILLNRPTHLALTFMNYKFPDMWGAGENAVYPEKMLEWVRDVSREARYARVGILSFGPQLEHTHYIG